MKAMPQDMLLFFEVARSGSLTAAARALGLPKSTVSRRLAQHEQAFGARLFNRTTRRISLTSLGEAYFDRCAAVAREVGEARAFATAATTRVEGRLRVSMTTELGIYWMAEFLADFSLRHPDVTLHFDFTARRVDLVAERIDVALRIGRLEDSTLAARKITTIDRALYASPAYIERVGAPSRPEDLSEHRFVLLEAHTGRVPKIELLGPDGRRRVPISGKLISNSLGMVRALTLTGGGIGAIPKRMCTENVERGQLVEVLPDWSGTSLDVHCVFQGHKLIPAPTRAFVEELASWFARRRR